MSPPDARTLPFLALNTFDASSTSMRTFRVYPAVVARFFRHVTSGSAARVYGCVVGVQSGGTLEIYDSFDLLFDPVSGSLNLDLLEEELKFYKMASLRFRVLGWYSTGSVVQDSDMQIHRALMEATGGSGKFYYLLLNPESNLSKKELHMTIYEGAVSSTDNGRSELIFATSKCMVEAVSSEGVSVHYGADLQEQEDARFNKNPHWTFRKMLLETPSGFAMLDVAERLLLYPEEIWAWLTYPEDAHRVVISLGFIEVENKSVAWKSDVGPGKDLTDFILKFSHSKPMVVPDMQLKHVIEKNLYIQCWFDAHTVDELLWGINYILEEFVPDEENVNITKKCLVSEQLGNQIKAYGFDIPSHMIDKEFIAAVRHLYLLELFSKAYCEILRYNFCYFYYVAEAVSDLEFAQKVAVFLRSKEMLLPTDSMYITEEFLKFIDFILDAPEKVKGVIDRLHRMVLVANGKSLLDSEPQLQKIVLKPPGVVGLPRLYPHIAILCLGGCAILAMKALSSLSHQ